jgi:hypothetical protein
LLDDDEPLEMVLEGRFDAYNQDVAHYEDDIMPLMMSIVLLDEHCAP